MGGKDEECLGEGRRRSKDEKVNRVGRIKWLSKGTRMIDIKWKCEGK